MACFSTIHQAITRLQAVSASQLQLETICIGPLRPPCDRKLQAFSHSKRPGLSIHSADRCRLLLFATAVVLQEVDFVWKGEGSQVLLSGDFLNWDTKVSLVKGADGTFHCKQKLSPGTYNYKYIIDGKWIHSPDSPTVEDGQGGFNNQITVTDGPSASVSSPTKEIAAKEAANATDTADTAPKSAASPKTDAGPSASVSSPSKEIAANATDTADTAPKSAASPKADAAPKAAPAPKPAKVEKPYPDLITEDVIPKVTSELRKQEGVLDIDIVFQDNQIEGSFMKNGIIYTFWAFFPDGKLEGARGFSLSSHGAPPSTVEPFLIDEKKITADLLIFWIMKRLAAQKIIVW